MRWSGPRRQHVRGQRRPRRHRGLGDGPDRAVLIRHGSSAMGADDDGSAQLALDRRPQYFETLLPRARDGNRLHRPQAVGDPYASRGGGLPRGADDHPITRTRPPSSPSGSTPAATSPTCSRSRTLKLGSYSATKTGATRLGYHRESFQRVTLFGVRPGAAGRARPDVRRSDRTRHMDDGSRRGHGRRRVGDVRPSRERAAQACAAEHGAKPRSVDEGAPRLECDWEPLKRTYRRSLVDHRPALLAAGGRGRAPAAGLPWFMTMFGRDSIFTSSRRSVHARDGGRHPAGARRLAGQPVDDFQDEDPGRILHEMRYGEMAAFEERPLALPRSSQPVPWCCSTSTSAGRATASSFVTSNSKPEPL